MKCEKCSNAVSRFVKVGLCDKCYFKDYYQKNKEIIKERSKKHWKEHYVPIPKSARKKRLSKCGEIKCVWCETILIDKYGKVIERAVDHYTENGLCVNCKFVKSETDCETKLIKLVKV